MSPRATAALLCLLCVVAAAGRPAGSAPPVRSLAGDLLVATTDMPDPRFARTVIYMVRHDQSGAQGVVVNRPVGDVPLARLLERMRMDPTGASGTVRLYAGGPVQPLNVLVLHTSDYQGPGTVAIRDGISLTIEPDIVRAIALGKGPRRALFTLGYAGWAPGQLEAEIEAGGWVRAAPDESILFGDDYDKKWERALARQKFDL